jgi:hypothetical protein
MLSRQVRAAPRRQYWSGTDYAPDPNNAWRFRFDTGEQEINHKQVNSTLYVWAVHDGDISVVPVPAAVWLFGSALGLLGWIRRKAT